jgi:PilZ domain-containing protein
MTPFPTTRLWPRYAVDLPVQVVCHQGAQKLAVPGLGTDLSRNGMALYAGLMLKVGDPIEVEFQIPSRLRIVCIIRNRDGYCFGLEFLTLLPS